MSGRRGKVLQRRWSGPNFLEVSAFHQLPDGTFSIEDAGAVSTNPGNDAFDEWKSNPRWRFWSST
jgi:hypothetical protein